MYTHPLGRIDLAAIVFAMAPILRRVPERRSGLEKAE